MNAKKDKSTSVEVFTWWEPEKSEGVRGQISFIFLGS